MSDYKDETSLTDEEIAEAIAAAKRAKAAKKAKAAEQKKSETKPQQNAVVDVRKTESGDEESSKELFDEIDQTVDTEKEENLSPKMKSAKSFSNAFAAAKIKRDEELKRKKAEKEAKEAAEEEGEDPDFEEEEVTDEEIKEAFEEDNEENITDTEDADFDIDSEDYEEYEETDEDNENYDGIFEPDEEETTSYSNAVKINDEDEDLDDDDEDDEEDEEEAFSTKTKVIIGVIIALLVVAIVAAGAYFFSHRDNGKQEEVSSVAVDNSVKSIKFKESSLSLKVGETAALEIIVDPEGAADKVFKLKSNDPAIAKVDEQGKVTGVSSGSTTITATLKNNETITASLVVNVIDEKQNTINEYNKFINSILDGSTDIDSTDTQSDEDNEDASDSDSDSDTENTKPTPKSVLSGSIIRDLDSDGELELALYYENSDEDANNVRLFYFAVEGEEEKETEYDEFGNPIEKEDTASDEKKDSDAAQKEKVLTEADEYSEKYALCYDTLQRDATGWDTCLVQVKEDEVAQARVTILSEDYTSPTYVYECDDETIATVDNQGNIKGIKPGITFVTVTSPLNSDAIAKIKVKVKDDTDLLEDYLAQVPKVNATNDNVIPTETLTGKAITDLDGDGVSELLLRFNYGNNVETINIVKVENDQCVVYKTYNNISDLYEYYEGDGSYKNQVLIHYTTGKVCMQYNATVAKTNSKTRTSEQKILSLENNGSLSELVNFSTTTDISTKTVTSEVTVSEDNTVTSSRVITESSDEDKDSETYYEPEDTNSDEDEENDYQLSYMAVDVDELVSGRGISLANKTAEKKLPVIVGAPDDDDENDYDNDDDDETTSENNNDDEPTTSTVTTEVTEETTKYFVNGTPVEQSVYEEYLSTYAARYSVWSSWESV